MNLHDPSFNLRQNKMTVGQSQNALEKTFRCVTGMSQERHTVTSHVQLRVMPL